MFVINFPFLLSHHSTARGERSQEGGVQERENGTKVQSVPGGVIMLDLNHT